MRPAHLVRSIVALSAAAPAFLVVGPSTAAVRGCATGVDDFDGNGGTDLAIGAPGVDHNRGAVYVEMKSSDGTRQIAVHPPAKSKGFGQSVGEVDLSNHTDASVPCSNLVVGGGRGSIFLYRWDPAAGNFVLLNQIAEKQFGSRIHGFGDELASPLEPTSTPSPRAPVLYVGAASTKGPTGYAEPGAVVRLVLNSNGTVRSSQVIQPGESATANMPMTRPRTHAFGSELSPTTDPNEVIVSAPSSRVSGMRHAGAVLDWHRGGRSTLITESTPGVPGSAEIDDYFGETMWLSSEAATATGTATYLFVAAPSEDIGEKQDAGAVWQFRYRPHATRRVDTASVRVWTQRTPGVYGAVHAEALFGMQIEAVSISRGVPDYAALVDYREDVPRLVGLGTASQYPVWNSVRAVSSWRDVNDNLASDPFPATAPKHWAGGVVVSNFYQDKVKVGLPSHTATTYQASECSPHPDQPCLFGWSLTDTGG